MSEEREKGKEAVISLDHFYHGHPLILSKVGRSGGECSGCSRYVHPGETAYQCREGYCFTAVLLHEECAEMPREIKLSMHPQHTLNQKKVTYIPSCAVCRKDIRCLGYYCGSLDGCGFQVHVGCVQITEVLPFFNPHPSHPHHPLTLMCRSRLSYALLRCDACGTIEKGIFHTCMICQYLIHDGCARLSATAQFPHHHHPLSLAYQLPLEYVKYDFKCDICLMALVPKHWVYHCEDCRYVVHIKCAINTTTSCCCCLCRTNIDADAGEDEGVIVFPLKNGVEELIASFVTKVGGVMPKILNDEIVNGKYKFHNHGHHLQLISLSSSLHPQEEEEEYEDEEKVEVEESDDDDDYFFNKSELVCDGCTAPIFPNQQKSSQHKYFCCGECPYFLHLSCFNLPPQIPSHPLHPNHNLILLTPPKLDFVYCYICRNITNGLFYECTICSFIIDIKCASLPFTIKHKAHSRHHLKLVTMDYHATHENDYGLKCNACGGFIHYGGASYECDVCNIILHSSCVLMPTFVISREWDTHRLPFTFDARINHPSSFCCDICEDEMNPRSWMYHCRTCDFSAHPKCFPADSGIYQNMKFGQQYDVPSVHHHTLEYQLLNKKLYCDVCGQRKSYGCVGFQCATDKCEFFMCGDTCFPRFVLKSNFVESKFELRIREK